MTTLVTASRLPFDRYDRTAITNGVLHLGLGAFHRAHQAPVFDTLVARGDTRWGITGVAMRSPGVVAALASQGGLYSLVVKGEQPEPPRVIGAITRLHVAAHDPAAVITAIADPQTQLVTLTVTEKGYLDLVSGSAMAMIAEALERRRIVGAGPVTIMSCDNRAANGPFTRSAVLAAARGMGLPAIGLRWIEEEVAFPSTMVDRITPAVTMAMIDDSSAALGVRDEAAVWTEPFWQWVVEDRFAAARPDLAAVGVTFVSDVAPWEDAKLRMLNAAHSALAYHGLLRGHTYVHQAIGDPVLRRQIDALWDEAAETLDRHVVDVAAYRAALIRRFANPNLHHALIQIAADGSQKIQPRIIATIADRQSRGLASPALAAVVEQWIIALNTVDGLNDPLLPELEALISSYAPVDRFLDLIGIVPDVAITADITRALARSLS